MRHYKLIGLMATILLLSSCSVMCPKKINLKDTVWTAQYGVFVADAGTMTCTLTLSFPSANTFKLVTSSYLPPHPSMAIGPDGKVEMMPARSSEFTEEGTWTFKKDILYLHINDGPTKELIYRDGAFESQERTDTGTYKFTKQ